MIVRPPAKSVLCKPAQSQPLLAAAVQSKLDIVDGKLYLNLDSKARAIWLKDVPGRIQQGNTNWTKIANTSAFAL